MLNSYGITSGAGLLNETALGISKYYGLWYYEVNGERYEGSTGYFWTATPYSSENAYRLSYTKDGVYPTDNDGKGRGFSVRCLAR